ncbi:MAG: hypothetical protein BWY04_00826 [candidate division CPR1 bacterium ADurb.Bin160]|jgi:hypothetical protein|uniref:Uncharacterized protein n=1 Tax=candidate division CPR1 bacterium ADurb.Bin160 TaxID=1852826 RepID=A0A1V5ZMY0_9BACT|nr:MAG: hypothetical protein BWY04_00826 [candidate division CPR1 bacterium ADurb.Bin160]
MLVVVDQVLPLKLYGVLCNQTPLPSDTLVIVKVQSRHSSHKSLLNINSGPCLSIFIGNDVFGNSSFQAVSTL